MGVQPDGLLHLPHSYPLPWGAWLSQAWFIFCHVPRGSPELTRFLQMPRACYFIPSTCPALC